MYAVGTCLTQLIKPPPLCIGCLNFERQSSFLNSAQRSSSNKLCILVQVKQFTAEVNMSISFFFFFDHCKKSWKDIFKLAFTIQTIQSQFPSTFKAFNSRKNDLTPDNSLCLVWTQSVGFQQRIGRHRHRNSKAIDISMNRFLNIFLF